MKSRYFTLGIVLSLVAGFALVAAGCGKAPPRKGARKVHDHSEWWCRDHGVPEEECSMCLSEDKVKRLFKDKGDWCEEHNRAKSQCFKCDPSRKETFAVRYREKFGKEPPPIAEEEAKPNDKK